MSNSWTMDIRYDQWIYNINYGYTTWSINIQYHLLINNKTYEYIICWVYIHYFGKGWKSTDNLQWIVHTTMEIKKKSFFFFLVKAFLHWCLFLVLFLENWANGIFQIESRLEQCQYLHKRLSLSAGWLPYQWSPNNIGILFMPTNWNLHQVLR